MIDARSALLIDTNVLLRLMNPANEQHVICREAVRNLQASDCRLCLTLQNAAKFWNASTRPQERNGLGLSVAETDRRLKRIEQIMTLLPDDARVYAAWRDLVSANDVRGIQVHDAKLAAAMIAHRVPHILTLNTKDFSRYSGIQAVHPANV